MSKKTRKERRRARTKASRAADRRGESCRHRTLAAIKEYFESQGLCLLGSPEARCLHLDLTFYPPEAVSYRDENGDATCPVIIDVSEDGQNVIVASPDAWYLRDCQHRAAVYETLVRMTPDYAIRFQHDPKSDGVTPSTIVTVGDREVFGDLVELGVARLIHAIPRWDSAIRRVMETGEVSMPSFPGDGEELSVDELKRIGQDLADRLAEDDVARWQRFCENVVAAAGSNGTMTISEELGGNCLLGTAAIVHGGHVLGLTRTLPSRFEKFPKLVRMLGL